MYSLLAPLRRACFVFFGMLVPLADAHGVTIGLNFTGTSLGESNFAPPDTMGTVGRDHVVELINGRYQVYHKFTGENQRNQPLDTFWMNAGVNPSGGFAFDPRVQYDPQTDRYFATSVDNFGNPNRLLVAVSNTGNPLNGWKGFAVDSDTDNLQWADFPQMGFNHESLVISANMFDVTGGDNFDVNVLTIPKADLVSNTPTVANATLLENLFNTAAMGNFSLQPGVDIRGSGRPLRLFTTDSSLENQVEVLEVVGGVAQNLLVTLPPVTGLTPYPPPPLAEQPGPKVNLQSGGRRTRSAVTLIGDHYYGVHGVEVSGRAAQRWYKINADTLTLTDEGVIADPNMDFIYGSIAANELGDVVIGFTGTSETQFPSAYAVVGETSSLGALAFDAPILLKEGVSDYQLLDGIGRNRWGDYSATVLDPTNPRIFWTFQEFVSATNEWSIQISQLSLGASGDFDANGSYECEDIDALVAEIVSGDGNLAFDLSGDGRVNIADLEAWLVEAGLAEQGAAFRPGDANLDGAVNGIDFVTWNQNKFTQAFGWCAGDFDASGSVAGNDFVIWNLNKFDSMAVPEPSSWARLLMLACLLWRPMPALARS